MKKRKNGTRVVYTGEVGIYTAYRFHLDYDQATDTRREPRCAADVGKQKVRGS